MINWKQKLTSRKWWLSVAAFVVALQVLFGVEAETSERIAALILLAADVIGYTLAEGLTDSANITLNGGEKECD